MRTVLDDGKREHHRVGTDVVLLSAYCDGVGDRYRCHLKASEFVELVDGAVGCNQQSAVVDILLEQCAVGFGEGSACASESGSRRIYVAEVVQGLKHSVRIDIVFTVAFAEEPVELHVGQFHLASVNLVDSLQFGVQCEVGSLRSVALYAHYSHHIARDVGHDDVLLDNLERIAVCRTYVVRLAPRSWLVGIVLTWIGYRDVVVLARGKVEVAVGNYEASVAAVVVLEHRHVVLAVG